MKVKIRKEMIKNIIIKSVIIIFLIVFIVCVYFLIKDYFGYKENNDSIEDLIEDAVDVDTETQETTIDWNYLQSINPDIIGWITIENTIINYPIMQDTNYLYYLKHTYEKKYNSNGSIFTIDTNPFEIEETTIYGHNMKNGTMFSILDKYMNEEFLYNHLDIKIYTPTKNYEGKIFSVYSIGYGTEINNINGLNFEEKIEYYKNASKYTIDSIDNISKIIKLSTCSYINNRSYPTNQRYYIIANITPIE